MSDGSSITPPLALWRHGDSQGRCTCCPSCVLFPRSVDGKVLLPNPLTVIMKQKVGDTTTTQTTTQTTMRPPPPEKRARARCCEREHAVGDREVQELPEALAPSAPKPVLLPSAAGMESEPQPPLPVDITTYAQLSSLPGFKAFKLNNTQTQDAPARRRYIPVVVQPDDNPSPGPRGQEFIMEEIRVMKRTKKQNYVRSGTHDFRVRLYMGQQQQNEDSN